MTPRNGDGRKIDAVLFDCDGVLVDSERVATECIIEFAARFGAVFELDEALESRIRSHIRANATPRHVPARIVQVTDIPRTRSGKITELAVRDVVHGREVTNKEALANPEALDQFAGRVELQS